MLKRNIEKGWRRSGCRGGSGGGAGGRWIELLGSEIGPWNLNC